MNKTNTSYGDLIKRVRKQHNYTQIQLAEKLSVGKTAVSNYETGYSIPSINVLRKIADVFDLSLVEFLALAESDELTASLERPRLYQTEDKVIVPYIKSGNVIAEVLKETKYMDDYLAMPSFMLDNNHEDCLCVKMVDDSMNEAGIHKNDFLFVSKSDIPCNDKIVMMIDIENNTYLIRKCITDNHIITLLPESYSMDYPIVRVDLRDNKFIMVGHIVKILKNMEIV